MSKHRIKHRIDRLQQEDDHDYGKGARSECRSGERGRASEPEEKQRRLPRARRRTMAVEKTEKDAKKRYNYGDNGNP
jgi:hypothetical protein